MANQFVLYEDASGYAIFKKIEGEEIAQDHEELQKQVSEILRETKNAFGKLQFLDAVVHMVMSTCHVNTWSCQHSAWYNTGPRHMMSSCAYGTHQHWHTTASYTITNHGHGGPRNNVSVQ